MVLVSYRHGFRTGELVDLRWDQIDFNAATMAVCRAKKGSPGSGVMNSGHCAVYSESRSQGTPMCSPRKGVHRSRRQGLPR
jgi:integrase